MQRGIIPVHVKRELQEAPPFAAALVDHFLIRLGARRLADQSDPDAGRVRAVNAHVQSAPEIPEKHPAAVPQDDPLTSHIPCVSQAMT